MVIAHLGSGCPAQLKGGATSVQGHKSGGERKGKKEGKRLGRKTALF